jgi:hypothetical protein
LNTPHPCAKISGVITGYNTDIKHNERVFHVQTEDKGVDNPVIESLIYMGGKIIASRQYSYASLLREGYSEKVVQELLDSQHKKMMRDVKGGRYDPDGPPAFGAGIITDTSFDSLVLEFLGGQGVTESIELVLKGEAGVKAGDARVLELLVRSEARNKPVAEAEVRVKLNPTGKERSTILFEGVTGEDGRVQAGIQVPKEFAGASITVEARSDLGRDEVVLPVRE